MPRKSVPLFERRASLVLLIVPVLTLLWVFVYPLFDSVSSTAVQTASGIDYSLPSEWQSSEAWQSFPAERIYEKINGRAVIFEDFGVKGLDFASFSGRGLSFDVYIYVMADADGAAGIFVKETPSGAQAIDLGDRADIAGVQLRMINGSSYIVILPLSREADNSITMAFAGDLLKNFKSSGTDKAVSAVSWPGSFKLKSEPVLNRKGALGLASLAGLYTAVFEKGGVEYILFQQEKSRLEDPELLASLKAELEEFGAEEVRLSGDRLEAMFFSQVIILEFQGEVLYGIAGGEDLDKALDLFDAFIKAAGERG